MKDTWDIIQTYGIILIDLIYSGSILCLVKFLNCGINAKGNSPASFKQKWSGPPK